MKLIIASKTEFKKIEKAIFSKCDKTNATGYAEGRPTIDGKLAMKYPDFDIDLSSFTFKIVEYTSNLFPSDDG